MRQMILECLKALDEDIDVVNDDTDLIEDLNLDSISIINLIFMIEEHFNIDITNMTEFVNSLKAFGELVTYMERLMSYEK